MYAFIKHLSLIFNHISKLEKNQMLGPDVHTAGMSSIQSAQYMHYCYGY